MIPRVGVFCRAVALALVGSSAVAEQPPHDSLRRSLYVLRYRIPGAAEDRQGIWRFDLDTRTYSRISPLFYGERGGASLGAFEDRLLLQGHDFVEYELPTMRLLRRYDDAAQTTQVDAFHGAVITENQARRLNVEAGVYGFRMQVQIFHGNTWYPAEPDILFRRSLDPSRSDLRPVHQFSLFPGGSAYRRYVTFDENRRQLWALSEGAEGPWNAIGVKRISVLPLTGFGVGPETIVRETKSDAADPSRPPPRIYRAFSYASADDSFFGGYHFTDLLTGHFVKWDISFVYEEMLRESQRNAGDFPVGIAALPVELPTEYLQVIPAVGYGSGLNGTSWRSDLWLFNPSDETSAVSIRRVSQRNRKRRYLLPAHGSLKVNDVLRDLGGGPRDVGGDGIITDALVIQAPYRWGAQIVAVSRSYTSAPAGEPAGTYGHAVPAVPSREGYSTHLNDFESVHELESLYNSFPEFILDKRNLDRFRHNVGVVNDSDESMRVTLRHGSRGASEPPPSSEATFYVPPRSVRSVNLEKLFTEEAFSTRGPRVWISASRPAPVWISMVDNRTGDATFVPFNTFGLRSDAETRLAIPLAIRDTAGDTEWKTDLYGYFPQIEGSEPEQQPLTSFYPERPERCGATVVQRRIQGMAGPEPPGTSSNPYWHSIFPDVLSQFTECNSDEGLTGAIELPLASWMSGYSRTYTTRPDGGTYGEMLPFYPAGGWPVQHFAGIEIGRQVRVEIGLYNGLNREVTHRLLLYDAAGRLAGQHTLNVQPRASLRLAVLDAFGPLRQGTYGLTVLPLDNTNGPGRSWAYVSLIDTATGDPTTWW